MKDGEIVNSPVCYHMINPSALLKYGIDHVPFSTKGSKTVKSCLDEAGDTRDVKELVSAIPAAAKLYPWDTEGEGFDYDRLYQYESTVAGAAANRANDETQVSVAFQDNLDYQMVKTALNEQFGFDATGLFEVVVVGLINNTFAYNSEGEKKTVAKIFFTVGAYSLYAREVRENGDNTEDVLQSTPGHARGQKLGQHIKNRIQQANQRQAEYARWLKGEENKTVNDLIDESVISSVQPEAKPKPALEPEAKSEPTPEPKFIADIRKMSAEVADTLLEEGLVSFSRLTERHRIMKNAQKLKEGDEKVSVESILNYARNCKQDTGFAPTASTSESDLDLDSLPDLPSDYSEKSNAVYSEESNAVEVLQSTPGHARGQKLGQHIKNRIQQAKQRQARHEAFLNNEPLENTSEDIVNECAQATAESEATEAESQSVTEA